MRKFTTLALSAGLVMAMMVPTFADDMINVTVNVNSDTAAEAGLDVPYVSLNGYVVEVAAGTTAVDALKKALDENEIKYDIQASDYGTYISSIGGLGGYANPAATPDYSGWMLEYNNDGFTNWGIDTLGANKDGIIGDGDVISLDYSLYMGADLGTASAPFLKTLKINDTEINFSKVFKGYDETTYAPIFEYVVEGGVLNGTGTAEDPFKIEIDLGEVEMPAFEIDADTSSFFEVKDIVDGTDFSKPLTFTVESKYGIKSYFEITAKYTSDAKIDEDIFDGIADGAGDVNVASLAVLMISAMAVMMILKKKEA